MVYFCPISAQELMLLHKLKHTQFFVEKKHSRLTNLDAVISSPEPKAHKVSL